MKHLNFFIQLVLSLVNSLNNYFYLLIMIFRLCFSYRLVNSLTKNYFWKCLQIINNQLLYLLVKRLNFNSYTWAKLLRLNIVDCLNIWGNCLKILLLFLLLRNQQYLLWQTRYKFNHQLYIVFQIYKVSIFEFDWECKLEAWIAKHINLKLNLI
jgi:hypothetical protein